MSKNTASTLGPEHYRAICDEVGARLAQVLRPAASAPSPRIAELLDRLARLDHDVPSIVPSIDDMEPLEETSLVQR
ncbi:MAG: hypothetical protein ACREDY_16855 [Bradyrhizobium sp.]